MFWEWNILEFILRISTILGKIFSIVGCAAFKELLDFAFSWTLAFTANYGLLLTLFDVVLLFPCLFSLVDKLLLFCLGRSGRAGRSGEAITLYTEEDKPFLRNIANVMAASGCEVPSWILALPKLRRRKHRPQRDSIATIPEENTVL